MKPILVPLKFLVWQYFVWELMSSDFHLHYLKHMGRHLWSSCFIYENRLWIFYHGTDLPCVFLSCGYWLQDKFIFRDSSYVTIPLSNYQHPVPTLLKYWDVPSQGWLLINWAFAFTLCNIIAVLQSTINHFILVFILWPFGNFFI